MYRPFFVSLFCICLLAGCFPLAESNENFSSEYREDNKIFHPEFTLFHFSPDSSRLFIRFNTNDLLFTRQEEDTFRATFRVRIRIVDSYQSPMERDTAGATFHVNKTLEGAGMRIYTIDFHLPQAGEYLVEYTMSDSSRKVSETEYLQLDNSSPQSRQNFFLYHPGSFTPFFNNYISSSDTFCLNYRNDSSKVLFVRYYNKDFELPPPPYSYEMRRQFNYIADGIFNIYTGRSNQYVFSKEGIYQLQWDTLSHEGFSVFRFGDGFPAVTTPKALLMPLRYICTRKEFDNLRTSAKVKQATDKFWLEIGGNQERSRQLIKKFYSRVEKANRLFSSFTEGWRTDRGMIYVVFGNPHTVYKSSSSESWTYGEPTNSQSVTFTFTKVDNPFTDNDFVLNRAPIYETIWYKAVDTWHQGRAFNDLQ